MDNPVMFALAQIEVIPGRPDLNTERIIKEIKAAKDRRVKVIVFPEMSVPGYLLGDEWENDDFIHDLMSFNEDIRQETDGIVAIWGNVFADFTKVGEDGRTRKYNTVYIAQNKKWVSNGVFKGYSYKTLMPKYRMFDDERHFFSMLKLANELKYPLTELLKPFPVKIDGKTVLLGLTLCEDMWCQDYHDNPTKILVKNGAEVMINISCSPWTWRKNDKRHRVVASLLSDCQIPFIYVNNVGIQNNGKNIFLFDGKSTVYNPNGKVRKCVESYQDLTLDMVIDSQNHPEYTEDQPEDRDTRELYEGLIYGIRQFMKSIGKKDVVLGLSGGIDSAVVCCLMATALGPEHVYAVNMPSRYNSDLTKNAASTLGKALGVNYGVFPIQDVVDLTVENLSKTTFSRGYKNLTVTQLKLSGLDIENIQARDRSSRVLAAIASSLGAIFTNNGNKTETTIGYCTIYGDLDGAIAPIADLWKFEVYQLAEYINKQYGYSIIPEETINVVPSAELSAEQDVTQGKGDPIKYPYHDKLFRAFVEFRFSPEKILELYMKGKLEETLMMKKGTINKYFPKIEDFFVDLEKMWRLFKINVFKRIQAPPIIAVSRRAFGFDLRESQLQSGAYFTRRYYELKQKILTVD